MDYWNHVSSKDDESIILSIPELLHKLVQRIDVVLKLQMSSCQEVFVKLSTRSPKDSKTVFRKAVNAFKLRESSSGGYEYFNTSENNARLVIFSEEMLKACAVRNGTEAVTILLDSMRVAEDLMYAFEEGKEEFRISLVIRSWDSRIRPQCEFRGFVWNRKLTCLGQYWHSLYLPEIQDSSVRDRIAQDCFDLFDKIKDSLPVPNAMLDLAWMGPGEVLLIEVNPLMEGLGSFKGSTGLFDFYADALVLTGEAPFEMRIRTEEEDRATLISHMSMEWRKIVFGF